VDGQFFRTTVPVRGNFEDIREHLKHLGPSNRANNPKKTQSTTIKVKPGTGTHQAPPRAASPSEPIIQESQLAEHEEEEGDETTRLLRPEATSKDGLQVPGKSYGSVSPVLTVQMASQGNGVFPLALNKPDQAEQAVQVLAKTSQMEPSDVAAASAAGHQRGSSSGESGHSLWAEQNNHGGTHNNGRGLQRPNVRSGSITENVIESRGLRKVVLETTSSNDDDDFAVGPASPEQQPKPLGKSFTGFFARDEASKDRAGESEDEEALGSGRDEGDSSKEAAAPAVSGTGGGGGGKKKNRRRKRKGGK
jgi:metal transporter CNNM